MVDWLRYHFFMMVALEQFKSSCLELISLVSRTGEEVWVAQNGQALVKLVPAPALPPSAIFGKLAEETRVQGDIVSGLHEQWEADA
jgi:antitoxin (DNA-binding transcriptional repressor) of toxin-antitoxin stability system